MIGEDYTFNVNLNCSGVHNIIFTLLLTKEVKWAWITVLKLIQDVSQQATNISGVGWGHQRNRKMQWKIKSMKVFIFRLLVSIIFKHKKMVFLWTTNHMAMELGKTIYCSTAYLQCKVSKWQAFKSLMPSFMETGNPQILFASVRTI